MPELHLGACHMTEVALDASASRNAGITNPVSAFDGRKTMFL
jgi:hypothetical protein